MERVAGAGSEGLEMTSGRAAGGLVVLLPSCFTELWQEAERHSETRVGAAKVCKGATAARSHLHAGVGEQHGAGEGDNMKGSSQQHVLRGSSAPSSAKRMNYTYLNYIHPVPPSGQLPPVIWKKKSVKTTDSNKLSE